MLRGPPGRETGLLLLGRNGPREHERVWWVETVPPFPSALLWPHFARSPPPEIVDQPGVDIFGQVYNQWKNKECECPNCKRLIAASRFAPHLEKCLGMGRNSSRIANRRWVTGGGSERKEIDLFLSAEQVGHQQQHEQVGERPGGQR